VNRQDRLIELIHGGPYDRAAWIVMVHLATFADDQGILPACDVDQLAFWLGLDEEQRHRAEACLKHLLEQGWIHEAQEGQWDIGQGLRQGLPTRATDY
jgi:hypothetical protein